MIEVKGVEKVIKKGDLTRVFFNVMENDHEFKKPLKEHPALAMYFNIFLAKIEDELFKED